MLFNIHKVYTIYDYGDEGQTVLEFEKSELEQIDITAGKRNVLLGAIAGSKVDYTPVPVKIIDDNQGFRFSENIGQPSAIYVYLEKGYILDQLQVNPQTVDQDLLLEEFNHDSRLIYCFFISSIGQATIRGRKIKDATLQKKMVQSPNDIFLRRVLLQRSSLDYKSQLFQNKEFFTLDEIATYVDRNKRTIQNKVSQGKFLKPINLGGINVWDKKEFLDWYNKQKKN